MPRVRMKRPIWCPHLDEYGQPLLDENNEEIPIPAVLTPGDPCWSGQVEVPDGEDDYTYCRDIPTPAKWHSSLKLEKNTTMNVGEYLNIQRDATGYPAYGCASAQADLERTIDCLNDPYDSVVNDQSSPVPCCNTHGSDNSGLMLPVGTTHVHDLARSWSKGCTETDTILQQWLECDAGTYPNCSCRS